MSRLWTKKIWIRLAIKALRVLHDNDGMLSKQEVMRRVRKQAIGQDEIPQEQLEILADGRARWDVSVQCATIPFGHAGFLRKGKGIWRLTEQGAEVLAKAPDDGFLIEKGRIALDEHRRRKQEKRQHKLNHPVLSQNNVSADADAVLQELGDEEGGVNAIENYHSRALDEIQRYIRAMEPYEFQDLCAALLRGMGYHVRDVAAPGPDGGIDIVAYTDSLGAKPPRLKVQVKRYQEGNNVPVGEVRQLLGLLGDGDIGIFITSSGFTSGCRNTASNSDKHLELMDLPRFIELWRAHYKDIAEEDRAMLPLAPVYFLNKKGTDE